MHLYVIRHGQSFVNLDDWDGRDPDMPLTPLGERQAEAVAKWLPNYLPAVDAIYGSTLKRANQTAHTIARSYNNMPVRSDNRLREIGSNRIDHSPWPEGAVPAQSDWSAHLPTERPFDKVARSEGAESLMHFRIRVASFIEEMIEKHAQQTIIMVCHGGVMDAVFDYCFGVGPWRRCEVWTYNTAVTHFQYVAHPGRETWRLFEHNLVEHLREANMIS
jgi:broad specificity phosphatase PhoE